MLKPAHWLTIILFLLTAIILALWHPPGVRAQTIGGAEEDLRFQYRWTARRQCTYDWPQMCRTVWLKRRVYHHRYVYRVPETYRGAYGYRSDERRWDRHDCRDIHRAIGDQHLTIDGAKKAANDAWAGAIRFHFGEVWMQLDNARDVTYVCSRSSIKEGGVTNLGQTLTRCEISAAPCKAQRVHEDEEPRHEQR